MEITKKIKAVLKNLLSIGKPKEEVLYDNIVKKDIPKESAEEMTMRETVDGIKDALNTAKDSVTHLFEAEEGVEFARGDKTAAPKHAKKKPVAKKPVKKKTTATKKPVTTSTKKESPEKTTKTLNKKKPAAKKTLTKKASASKTTISKKDLKIALYAKNIEKFYGEVDKDFLALIVKNLGPSIYRKDAELVSCSDPKELDTVRRNFLIKKLGIDASQAVLDAAIQDVCEELKSTRTKYRATFYYSLAKKFKKESVLK